jgi:hypothetical protein
MDNKELQRAQREMFAACFKEAIREKNPAYALRCVRGAAKAPVRSGLRVCHGFKRVYRLFV